MTTQSLADLAEECRSLMRAARETASRLEFVADTLAARAVDLEAGAAAPAPEQLSLLTDQAPRDRSA